MYKDDFRGTYFHEHLAGGYCNDKNECLFTKY